MNELTNNDAGRDEVAGTDDKLTYQKLIRKSAGIGRTKDARKLQSLRSDIRTLQSDLKVDRLARKDEIAMIHGQVDKLDEVLGSVQAQVTELLSA